MVASLWVRTAVSEGIESMVARWPGKWAVSSVAMRICSWISCLQWKPVSEGVNNPTMRNEVLLNALQDSLNICMAVSKSSSRYKL